MVLESGTNLYAGVDVGASRTKVALINEQKELLSSYVKKSGTDFRENAKDSLENALGKIGTGPDSIRDCVSTGYGRKNVQFCSGSKTEIACHARGCYQIFGIAMAIVDIGGQDNKIINLDAYGKRIDFKMNRKCAAGTGAFLEEMAQRLDISLEDFDHLARQSQKMVELGSFCTVFAATEILEHIGQGKKVPDIIKGIYHSLFKRILEMDLLSGTLVMTGGVVAHNPFLTELTQEMIPNQVLVPKFPQFTGAFGAALYALNQNTIRR